MEIKQQLRWTLVREWMQNTRLQFELDSPITLSVRITSTLNIRLNWGFYTNNYTLSVFADHWVIIKWWQAVFVMKRKWNKSYNENRSSDDKQARVPDTYRETFFRTFSFCHRWFCNWQEDWKKLPKEVSEIFPSFHFDLGKKKLFPIEVLVICDNLQ